MGEGVPFGGVPSFFGLQNFASMGHSLCLADVWVTFFVRNLGPALYTNMVAIR